MKGWTADDLAKLGMARAVKTVAKRIAAETFADLCERSGLPRPVAEHRFHPERKWRFDWAWPDQRLALEVEGGVWSGGRHTRGAGFVKDMEKYNAATAHGWRVLRVTPSDVKKAETVALVRGCLEGVTAVENATAGVLARSMAIRATDAPEHSA